MLELFAGLALGILGSAAATPAAPELARQILEREKCQTALPLVDGASDAASATGATPGAEATKHRGAGESALGRLGIPAIPLWLVAIVAVGLAAIIALIWWPRRLPAASPVPRAPVATVEVQRPAPPRLADWESLAREGRFGDAIHALLLRALSDLARTDSAAAPAASLTSREVLRRATRLAAETRDALGTVVAAVERIHFGGRAASREDYEACAAQYRFFKQASQSRRQPARSEAGR